MFKLNFKKCFKTNLKKNKGVSLLEILIYTGVFVIVAGSITGILVNVLNVSTRQQASSEVDDNLRQVISIMGDKIRQSSLIETATNTNLVLRMAGFSTTTFFVVDDILYLTEGENEPVSLLSNKIKINSLDFQKIEQPGTKGGVRVNISLIYDDPKPSLSVSKSLVSTINRAAAISFGEDILPSINNLYSVGADNPRWLNGYFSGNVDVDGNIDATQLCIAGDCKNAWSAIGNLIGTGTADYISRWASTSTLENSIIYDNGTNIGIGTESPSSLLHINGSGGNTSGIKFTNSYDTFSGYFNDNNDNSDFSLTYSESGGIDIRFQSDGDISLGGGGNVGIGTTSPSEKLDVSGNIGLTGTIIPDNACGISGSILSWSDDVIESNGIFNIGPGYAYGAPMICPGKVTGISGRCMTANASNHVALEVRVNSVGQDCDTGEINSAYASQTTSGCNVSFNTGDAIGCYAKTETGSVSGCSCSVSVRFD